MPRSVLYLNREGVPIDAKRWKELQAEPSYFLVKEYDNAVVRVTLKWSGRVPNPDNTFPDYYPVFILLVQNYTQDGRLANDPAEGDKTYPDEATGIAAYEQFLLKWTESSTNDEGKFVEQDNDLTPPPPPDPNVPMSVASDLEEGAW